MWVVVAESVGVVAGSWVVGWCGCVGGGVHGSVWPRWWWVAVGMGLWVLWWWIFGFAVIFECCGSWGCGWQWRWMGPAVVWVCCIFTNREQKREREREREREIEGEKKYI